MQQIYRPFQPNDRTRIVVESPPEFDNANANDAPTYDMCFAFTFQGFFPKQLMQTLDKEFNLDEECKNYVMDSWRAEGMIEIPVTQIGPEILNHFIQKREEQKWKDLEQEQYQESRPNYRFSWKENIKITIRRIIRQLNVAFFFINGAIKGIIIEYKYTRKSS